MQYYVYMIALMTSFRLKTLFYDLQVGLMSKLYYQYRCFMHSDQHSMEISVDVLWFVGLDMMLDYWYYSWKPAPTHALQVILHQPEHIQV